VKNNIKNLVISAMLLALGFVLPFLTGQIQEIGSMLLPLHIPVLICGFVCGPIYAAVVGAILPVMRSIIFAMPPIYPVAVSMAFEMCVYGLIAGYVYQILPKKTINIYISLIISMIVGRLVYGVVMVIISGLSSTPYSFNIFITSVFFSGIPGIILQIVAIPPLIMILEKVGFINANKRTVTEH